MQEKQQPAITKTQTTSTSTPYQQDDIQTQQGLQKLIQQVTNLQPSFSSFKRIKKLMLKYGLAIMIYFKPFYQQLSSYQQSEQNIDNLQTLAGIGHQICKCKIKQIQFIYKYGIKKYQKEIKNYPNEMHFIQVVKQISRINSQYFKSRNTDSQAGKKYNLRVNQIKQKLFSSELDQQFLPNNLMKKSINKFMMAIPYSQCKRIQEQSEGQYASSSNYDSQPQEIFGNFYDHQKQITQSQKSNVSNISYTINSTQAEFQLQERGKKLCCRKFFYQNQWLNCEQDLRNTFLQISFPFSEQSLLIIKRTICSMLNCEGGKIYIGIIKHSTGKKQIKSCEYTQNEKQQVYKMFRRAVEKIQPEIITQKMYSVQFVPVCYPNRQFIPGANIIRVTVSYGIRNQIYSFQKDGFDFFPFRNDVQIVEKQGRQLLKVHKSIILKSLPIPIPLHQHPCQKPETGEPLHQHTSQKRYDKPPNISRMNQTDPSLQKQLQFSIVKHSNSMTLQKQTKKKAKKSEASSHQAQYINKQHVHYTYFYVIGLDEKHLSPIFIQKNINQNIKIQSSRDNKLVVRVHGNVEVQKARKILKKIQTKYEKKNIKIYEMGVELQVELKSFEEAIKLIKNLNLSYKIYGNNRIKFKLFRESFHAFIELQSKKIPVKFILDQPKNT